MKDALLFVTVIAIIALLITIMCLISNLETTKREIIKCQTQVEIEKLRLSHSQHQN